MPAEQIFIGAATCVLCLIGVWHASWLLEHTRKGQFLVNRLGETTGRNVLLVLLAIGATFGALLACGIVNPIRW